MDLALTEEQLAFKQLARDFLVKEVVPFRAEWDRRESVDVAIIPKMGELGFFGLTEPDNGSDPSDLATRATRAGTDWVINGSKIFITNGTWADACMVFARTGGPGARGISAFLVPTDTPGFVRTEIHGKLGLRGQATAELTFDDVRVPADAMVRNERGEPFGVAASKAKLFASEAAVKAANLAIQAFGGYGYVDEYPVQKFMRDARVMTSMKAPARSRSC